MHKPLSASRRSHAAAVLIVLAALSMRCSPGESEDGIAEEAEVLYFETIGMGQSGSLQDTTEVVIRDSLAWQMMAVRLQTREPFRPVDFSQYMVVLAALPQTTGGYRVQFKSIEKDGGTIAASYVVFAPGPDCLTIAALTLPYQAVAVRKAQGDVDFRRSVTWESCTID